MKVDAYKRVGYTTSSHNNLLPSNVHVKEYYKTLITHPVSNPIALFRSFYEDIVYSGLREDYTPAKRKKTIRFNQFILLILIAHFVCVISYFCFGLYISALINLSAAYIFIVAYHLNLRRQFKLARFV